MRWVFFRPRSRSPYYDPEIQEPLGLEYLAAARRSRGDELLVLDGALSGGGDERLARRAAAFAPDAVGFSLTTALEAEAVEALHASIGAAPGGRAVRFVAGGNFVTTETDRAAAILPRAVTLVRLEGEEALEVLARAWGAGDDTPRVLEGPPAAELDRLPFPERPFAPEIVGGGWAFALQGSRGCAGACRYCASPGMRPRGLPGWRGRSPAAIAEEIALLHGRWGARAFNFVDEDFLGPDDGAPGRALAFAAELRRRGLRISFGIQARPGTLAPETVDALCEAGLTYAFVGLESDAPEDLLRWGRRPQDRALAAVQRLRARGAEVHAGTLLFHPKATLASVERFARSLVRHGVFDLLAAQNRLDAMPGSALHREALERGEIDPANSGPQPLPFADTAVAALHRDVVSALAPLGPPWMHAACSLPALLARARVEPTPPPALAPLRSILAELRRETAAAFFALLSRRAERLPCGGAVEELRRRHLELACRVARDLAAAGLVPSLDALREAIRKDAGM
jgi:radical SAM superfamily enzyme YgiQ (UPF0313 family)